ncbi:MAG TPA: hypothetical protein VF940_20080, partial [Streptosporangiaceae bacterium]
VGPATSRAWSASSPKLQPIRHEPDPDPERRFRKRLSLRTTCEDPECPGFIDAGNEAVEFGPSRRLAAKPARHPARSQMGKCMMRITRDTEREE